MENERKKNLQKVNDETVDQLNINFLAFSNQNNYFKNGKLQTGFYFSQILDPGK